MQWLAEICVKRPVFATMLVMSLVVVGAFSFMSLDADAAPVWRISVSAPVSLREVTETAKHRIKERIESVNGVGQITIIGGQERQINVWVDPDKMRSYNVTPAEVNGALKIQNMEFPSGRLDEGQKETAVRTVGKIQKPQEFDNVVVAT